MHTYAICKVYIVNAKSNVMAWILDTIGYPVKLVVT